MKRKFALINGQIYNGYDTYSGQALLVDGNEIYGILPEHAIPKGFKQIDVNGANICPGLIDLQIYGAGNDLFSATLSDSSISRIEMALLQEGCTSFMLTLATNTLDVFKEAITVFKKAEPKVALGLHLEGPFLNPTKRGAHPEELIIKATPTIIDDLLLHAGETVKMMTIAPECVDDSCLEKLLKADILISAGHSAATFVQAVQGFGKGIRATTHLWNAMSAFHHRDVGLPGATFAVKDATASIIADGIHVDFEAVKLSKQLLGERLFLITDAVATCHNGIYQHILQRDHYVLPDGTLSGSALTMLKAIRNCVEYADIPLEEAIRMATTYPANLIKRHDIGSLNTGMKANILIFNTDYQVEDVYFEGKQITKNHHRIF